MKTLRTGIGCTGMTLVCLLVLGSCEWGEPYVEPVTVTEQRVCRFMGMPCPPDCSTAVHREWAACMGVRYR